MKHNGEKTQMICVSGMPRSGSTLLVNILAQNPQITVSGTSGLLSLVETAKQQYTTGPSFNAQDPEQMRTRFVNAIRGMIDGWIESDTPFFVDKNRAWTARYELLQELYGVKPKIIVPIRDVRGVVASMEKLYRRNVLSTDPVTADNPLNSLTVEDRVQKWISTPPVGAAISMIRDSISRGVDSEMIFVRMEDLTEDPNRTMATIYDYLEMDRHSHNFSNIEQVTQEDDRIHGIPNLHTINNELQSIAKDWNRVIGSNVAEDLRTGYDWFYEYFYHGMR